MKPNTTRLSLLDGRSVPTAELEACVEQSLAKANVAGLSCAILNDGRVVYRKAFGERDRGAGVRNDEETVFAAASLSKTVFAYLVMLLVEEGVIDLDVPLHEYLARPLYEYPAYIDLESDERYKLITARMVLSHSTGLPNLRFLEPDGRLRFWFSPGERHSYSGEGIMLLQMVVEERTGTGLEALAQDKVFRPLGMTRSSYVWQAAYEGNVACPHDEYGRQRGLSLRRLQGEPGAGGSMATTAGDYARLLSLGILQVEGKRKSTVDEMLRPQIAIQYKNMFGPGAWQETDQYQDIRLSWGLGWGRFDTPYGRAFFHTGHGFGWQNYSVTYADRGIGIVLLGNSDNFESVAPQILEAAIGDTYSPCDWLGYPPFDPAIADKRPPPEPVAITVDPAILVTYVGAYEMESGQQLRARLQDGRLAIQGPDGEWTRLSAESETRLFAPQTDYRFNFEVDAQGMVTGVRLEIQGLALPLAKKIE